MDGRLTFSISNRLVNWRLYVCERQRWNNCVFRPTVGLYNTETMLLNLLELNECEESFNHTDQEKRVVWFLCFTRLGDRWWQILLFDLFNFIILRSLTSFKAGLLNSMGSNAQCLRKLWLFLSSVIAFVAWCWLQLNKIHLI